MTSADPGCNWYWQIWSLRSTCKLMRDHWPLVASSQFTKGLMCSSLCQHLILILDF